MKLLCAPAALARLNEADTLRIVLYGQPGAPERGSAGAALWRDGFAFFWSSCRVGLVCSGATATSIGPPLAFR